MTTRRATPKTKTHELKPLAIGGAVVDIAANSQLAAEVFADSIQQALGDHVRATGNNRTCTLSLRLVSDEAVQAYKRVKSWLHACKVNGVTVGALGVDVTRETRATCPGCGGRIRRDYLPAHQGSALCKEGKRVHDLAAAGYVEAGQAYRSLENAGVDVQWVPRHVYFDTDRHGTPHFHTADGYRVAPSWAVRIAEVTIVPHDLRTLVLEHCNEHSAARAALLAALRLDASNLKARRNVGQRSSTRQAAKMRTLFEQTLRHTGDA